MLLSPGCVFVVVFLFPKGKGNEMRLDECGGCVVGDGVAGFVGEGDIADDEQCGFASNRDHEIFAAPERKEEGAGGQVCDCLESERLVLFGV